MEILTRRRRAHRVGGHVAAVLAALLFWSASAGTQGVAAPALKAAFLFNFAKFSEWPHDALAPGQRLSMCVVGDTAIADALTQTIKGHPIGSHELTVTLLTGEVHDGASASRREGAWAAWLGSTAGCHVLYVSASEIKQTVELLRGARGASVFTVSDADRFAESGGVAQLIVQDDRIRFAINVTSAQHARLSISSKLLSLATIVKNDSLESRR